MNTTDTTTAPNSSARDRVTGTAFTRGLGVVILAGMTLLVILGLFVSPPDVNQGESVRIMYACAGCLAGLPCFCCHRNFIGRIFVETYPIAHVGSHRRRLG